MRRALALAASVAVGCGSGSKGADPEAAKARLRAAHAAMPAPGAVPACTGHGEATWPFARWSDLELLVNGRNIDGDEGLYGTPLLTWTRNKSVYHLVRPFVDTRLDREASGILGPPKLLVWKADTIKPPVYQVTEFLPGAVTGRVVQFDKAGKPECAWTINATNDVEVSYRKGLTGEAERMVQVNLVDAIDRQIGITVGGMPN